MSVENEVPMEYRAQIPDRCQRQHANRNDAAAWVEEWKCAASCTLPFSTKNLKILEAVIDWRLITNSGTDQGIIRPVIGSGGWPVIPGSSIKGLFRRACRKLQPKKLERWCGSPVTEKDPKPGVLRFHGAWPSNPNWHERLLDVAHPQQNWQLWNPQWDSNQNQYRRISHNANALISLYKPVLWIAYSSGDQDIEQDEWCEIRETLLKALEQGIGGRTCAGYGSSGRISGDLIFECGLEGQGRASTLLSANSGEFRANIFRAAIRGMSLRLFGGLCNSNDALKAVGFLFGSIHRQDGGLQRALLDSAFTDSIVKVDDNWGRGNMEASVYAVSGTLQWRLTKNNLTEDRREALSSLLASIHALAFSLGGFGRGWRRPDHRIFYPDYYTNPEPKPPIGCHWQWSEAENLSKHPNWAVNSKADLEKLIKTARFQAREWLRLNHKIQPSKQCASWREILHPEHMNIWIRDSTSPLDSKAIHWFHKSPDTRNYGDLDPRDLRGTSLAGRIQKNRKDRETEVGRIWSRMLPKLNASSLAQWQKKPSSGLNKASTSISPWPGPYLEVLVLFNDRHNMDNEPDHGPSLIQLIDEPGSPFQRVKILNP